MGRIDTFEPQDTSKVVQYVRIKRAYPVNESHCALPDPASNSMLVQNLVPFTELLRNI